MADSVDVVDIGFGQAVVAHSGCPYKNLQRLGTGGNATTFLVVATGGTFRGLPFAMKVFRRVSRPQWREAFLHEAPLLQRLDHPAVMKVFDSGVLGEDKPFVIAEYLPHTLHALIQAGLATVAEKVSYTLQLVSALRHLRRAGVVHRDIKPHNIFVKGRSCVLGDFGLAKRVDADDADDRDYLKHSLGPGMPWRYRTPELVAYLRGEQPLAIESDVYQLGLVVAELFTGRNPQKPARAIDQPVQLDALGPIPEAHRQQARNLIENMLDPDPRQRLHPDDLIAAWQGVFDVVAELRHTLEGAVF